MGTLDTLTDRLNEYLKKQGLPAFAAKPADVIRLYAQALRSVWTLEDRERRETMAAEVTEFLKPYIGGKKIEELFAELSGKLNAQRQHEQTRTEAADREKRVNTPGYVPSFDELFPDEKKKT
jgi:hypothetical protein